jgi:hypothetical protein
VGCIDAPGCEGAVEPREALSATGRSFPRCDRHWNDRLNKQVEIDARYPDSPVPPPGFDPAYAGERWDDD